MKSQLNRWSGIALISGSVLLIITMALHPLGGDIDHIMGMATMFIGIHSMAILAIPIVLYGFWGLTVHLSRNHSLSVLGFIFIAIGMIAAMIAAAINGLAVPFFLLNHPPFSSETEPIVKSILTYSFALNKAMDYVFIGGCLISVLLWSIIMLKKKLFHKWIGLFGILLFLVGLSGLMLQLSFTSLIGFQLFIFSWMTWVMAIGISLHRVES